MRIRHLTLCVFLLGIFAAASELRPVVAQAFSSRFEIGELQPGIKIYFVAKNDSENQTTELWAHVPESGSLK